MTLNLDLAPAATLVAYADDILLLAPSYWAMQDLLNVLGKQAVNK